MNENKFSLGWTIIVIAFLVYYGSTYIGNLGKYQGKSTQEWYDAYISEKSKNDTLNQSLQQVKSVQAAKDKQAQNLQECLDRADNNYLFDWASACKTLGKSGKCTMEDFWCKETFSGVNTSCTLPSYNADSLDNARQQDKENCFKQFPQ